MFTFSPWSLSKLLHCYLANVNWGILQFSPRSTAVLALRKISKTLYHTQAIQRLMNLCRTQVLHFLKKQGKQPLLHPINPHVLPRKGQFPAGAANEDVKLHFAVSTQPREHFLDARGFSPLSHWQARKENLADSRKSPDSRTLQTDSCLLPCLWHICQGLGCWNATATCPC